MTEERKHAILFATTLLSARKIIEAIDSSEINMGRDFWLDKFINKAIEHSTKILGKIDAKNPPTTS